MPLRDNERAQQRSKWKEYHQLWDEGKGAGIAYGLKGGPFGRFSKEKEIRFYCAPNDASSRITGFSNLRTGLQQPIYQFF